VRSPPGHPLKPKKKVYKPQNSKKNPVTFIPRGVKVRKRVRQPKTAHRECPHLGNRALLKHARESLNSLEDLAGKKRFRGGPRPSVMLEGMFSDDNHRWMTNGEPVSPLSVVISEVIIGRTEKS